MLCKMVGDAGDERSFGARDEEVERVRCGVLDESGEVRVGDGGDVVALGEAE